LAITFVVSPFSSSRAIANDLEVFPELHKLNPPRSIEDAGHLHDNLWSFPFGFGRQ
jgi:hypothetical protein